MNNFLFFYRKFNPFVLVSLCTGNDADLYFKNNGIKYAFQDFKKVLNKLSKISMLIDFALVDLYLLMFKFCGINKMQKINFFIFLVLTGLIKKDEVCKTITFQETLTKVKQVVRFSLKI